MPGRGPSIGRRSPPRASACCAAIAVQSSSARAAGRGDSSSRTSDETRLVLADRTVSVLEAAVGALAVLEEEWAHAAQTAIDADGDYPPEVCNHWLRHWRQLTEMAQGTSNGMIGGSAGLARHRNPPCPRAPGGWPWSVSLLGLAGRATELGYTVG